MTRPLLQTLLRSLTTGALVLNKNTSLADALAMFDHENIVLGNRIKPPPSGIAFQKRVETTLQSLVTACEHIASCISMWPRLETCLDAVLQGSSCNKSVTATRAWIQFLNKPPFSKSIGPGLSKGHVDENTRHYYARSRPKWLTSTLCGIGVLHSRLVKEELVAVGARDREAYEALENAVECNGLGHFFAGLYDISRSSTPKNARTRKDLLIGEQFANEMYSVILEGPMGKNREALSFASAVFSLAQLMVNIAPSPAMLFCGACASEDGKTPERSQLKKSLHQRGISIVRWCDDKSMLKSTRPLMFPPGWIDATNACPTTCLVLLEFTQK